MDSIDALISARIAKNLTTTTGDIIYASGANTPARLGIGATNAVLTVVGGVPVWQAPATLTRITGQVTGAGGITAGTGFSVVRNGVGDYTVTFTSAFAAVPIVIAQQTDTGHIWIAPVYSSILAGSFRVQLRDTTNTNFDGAFQFYATTVV